MDNQEQSFISSLDLVDNRIRIRSKISRVLKKQDVIYDPNKKMIVGGVTTHTEDDRRPAIIIEQDGWTTSRILVKCPCGRCSEIVCEYDEDVSPD